MFFQDIKCGPTGIEFYTEEAWLNKLPPPGGGEMIKEVTFEKTTYAELPHNLKRNAKFAGGIVWDCYRLYE
jgi:cysteine desulfurase/selenocysteine lyase